MATRGHIGLGNTLFQLGWSGLAGDGYPPPGTEGADLQRFDDLVQGLLSKPSSESDDPVASVIRPLVRNWTDAVRHYESALELDPRSEPAAHNRDLTMTYLKRLQELLDEETAQTEQQMPQPQDGEGEPSEEGGGGEDNPEGKGGEKGGKDPKENKEGDEPSNDDDQNDGKQKNQGDKPRPDDEGDPDKGPKDPNESPEDRARRILKENADLEKGPLTPGRREFRQPEKDW